MSEYLPLAKHLKGEGLQKGTVLECIGITGHAFRTIWRDNKIGNKEWNPFEYDWRIVSTPPKKITFETAIQHGGGHNPQYVYLPEPVDFVSAIVTVEEKR